MKNDGETGNAKSGREAHGISDWFHATLHPNRKVINNEKQNTLGNI